MQRNDVDLIRRGADALDTIGDTYSAKALHNLAATLDPDVPIDQTTPSVDASSDCGNAYEIALINAFAIIIFIGCLLFGLLLLLLLQVIIGIPVPVSILVGLISINFIAPFLAAYPEMRQRIAEAREYRRSLEHLE